MSGTHPRNQKKRKNIMCTHKKKIFNRYANQWLYVDCGVCPACLQQKANRRATRIRNHAQSTGQLGVFITLTYDNRFIPYVRKSDICLGCELPVYRDNSVRYVNAHKRSDGSFDTELRVVPGFRVLSSERLVFSSPNAARRFDPASFDSSKLPSLRFKKDGKYVVDKDKCGVALYHDFQTFYKRLHINYLRTYGKKLDTSFYACTEYGETYRRPHIHAVMFCDPKEYSQFVSCVRSSWSFDNGNRIDCQPARSVASYVASYVNCGSNFPRFFKEFFRPKCSYSRNFGLDNRMFQLDSVLAKIKQGDLRYVATRILDGQKETSLLPIPYYVLHRFFPKCKGYSRLSVDEAYRVALSPVDTLFTKQLELGLSPTEIRQYATRLRNSYERCRDFLNSRGRDYSLFQYAFDHAAAWRAFSSTLLKSSHECFDAMNYGDSWYFFDNISDVYDGKVFVDLGEPPALKLFDPNDFPSNIVLTDRLTSLYNKKMKQSKLTNEVMCQMGYNV